MTPGSSNIHPEQQDSCYSASGAQVKIRNLLEFSFFVDLELALGFVGSENQRLAFMWVLEEKQQICELFSFCCPC